MLLKLVSFFNIIISGLYVGALVGFSAAYDPTNYSILTYLQQQQGAILSVNTTILSINLVAFILTVISAFLEKKNKTNRILIAIAAVFFFICLMVVLFGIQPLNKIILTWKSTSIPANWTETRDEWWFCHQLRSTFSFLAFCLIVAVSARKSN